MRLDKIELDAETKQKLITILLALSLPIITVSVFGWNFKSYSKLWGTELEFLFIICNATTSFYLYQTPKWKIPAMFLLLLTAFSTEIYSTTHNVFAVLFFISCIYPLWGRKLFLYSYILSCLFGFLGLFYLEWATTYVICLFHLNSLYILWKFKNRN